VRRLALSLLLLPLPLLAGCASLAPVGSPAPGPAPAVTGTPAAAVPVPVPAAAPGAIDSTTVSPDGQRVLDSIPEPLAAGERVPPPAAGLEMAAPAASYDSLRLATPPPTDGPDAVPVPAPTQPLGDSPGSIERSRAADSAAAAAAATAPAAPAAPSKAVSDTCWRVQVAAPAEQERAQSLRAAAESQLMVPFVVERDQGLWKVRSAGCLDGARSESLRRRADLAGFAGVFRIATLARSTEVAR